MLIFSLYWEHEIFTKVRNRALLINSLVIRVGSWAQNRGIFLWKNSPKIVKNDLIDQTIFPYKFPRFCVMFFFRPVFNHSGQFFSKTACRPQHHDISYDRKNNLSGRGGGIGQNLIFWP